MCHQFQKKKKYNFSKIHTEHTSKHQKRGCTCVTRKEKEPETNAERVLQIYPPCTRIRAIAKERAREQRRREGRAVRGGGGRALQRDGKLERDDWSRNETERESEEEGVPGGRGCGVASVSAQWPGHRVLPVPRSPCSPLPVSDPVDSHTDSARYIVVVAVIIQHYVSSDHEALLPYRVLSRVSLFFIPLSFPISISLSSPFSVFSSRRVEDRTNRGTTNGVRVSDESRRVATWCDIR